MRSYIYRFSTFLVAFLWLFSTDALAANRTVCYELTFPDARTNCPTTSATGETRACAGGTGAQMPAFGHVIQLWDNDGTTADFSTDDYIGEWVISGVGSRCVTFNWAAPEGETDPDVYLRWINTVEDVGGGRRVVGKDGTGSAVSTVSFSGQYFADCTGTCDLGLLQFGYSTDTDTARRIMNLDSAQRGLEAFGSTLTNNVELWFPDDTSCTTGCSSTKTVIGFPGSGTAEIDGLLVTHELGHAVHKQQFNLDSPWPNPPADYSLNGSGWSITNKEYQHAATIEGFGDYVAMASWFDPNSGSTLPSGWGEDYETEYQEGATCSDNSGIPLQVAKSFWDWDDQHDENGVGNAVGQDDQDHWPTADIAKGWSFFAIGTANRQTKEADVDGVNVEDYVVNTDTEWWGGDSTLLETLRDHNCLGAQDD